MPFVALLFGFLSNILLLPCAGRPYGILLGFFAKEGSLQESVLKLIFYNLIFLLPVVLVVGFIFWLVSREKLENFRQRNGQTVKMILGLVMLLAGLYLIYNWI